MIKNVLNKRQRLLTTFKKFPSQDLTSRIVQIDLKVRLHILNTKFKIVRQRIFPGNSKSLWTAVKIAKDLNTSTTPLNMTLGGQKIPPNDQPDTFATILMKRLHQKKILVEYSVYNGKQKVISSEAMFMTLKTLNECIKTIKVKNCESLNRIPWSKSVDKVDHLTAPFITPFTLFYMQSKIPQQWLVAKVSPIFKKGSKSNI
jgi:hypothetical protein